MSAWAGQARGQGSRPGPLPSHRTLPLGPAARLARGANSDPPIPLPHPHTRADASDIWDELRAAQVVLLPGRAMHCRSKDPAFHSPYLRVSFSNASPADLEEGMRRLGGVLRARAAAAGGSAMVA